MILVFHPAARAELAAAGDWYDERVTGLGDKLIDAVEHAAALILEAPERYAVVPHDPRARRLVVEGFPFSVVYTLADARTVFVVAVAHHRRQPRYWARRLDSTGPGRR